MAPLNAVVASLAFTKASSISEAAQQFMSDRNIVFNFFSEHWKDVVDWLSQPCVFTVILAWVVTFTLVITLFWGLGFGPIGVIPGSLAAAFQAWAYGAFTPAGGIFATLTSLAMLGLLEPISVTLAASMATGVAFIVVASHGWACG